MSEMKKFIEGFRFAFSGIAHSIKTQRNMRFHLFAAVCVIAAGFIFNISTTEWFFAVFSIALVLAAELFNTAIEALTDLHTKDFHPLAKIAKDCSAGAVLVISIAAAIVGILIFLPHIISNLKTWL